MHPYVIFAIFLEAFIYQLTFTGSYVCWQKMLASSNVDSPQEIVLSNSRVLRDECNFIQNVGQFYNQQDMSDIILKVSCAQVCNFFFF